MEEQDTSIFMCHFEIGLWGFGLIYFLLSTDLCIKKSTLGSTVSGEAADQPCVIVLLH